MARTGYIIELDSEHKQYFFYPEPIDEDAFQGLVEFGELTHGPRVVVRRASDEELKGIDDELARMFEAIPEMPRPILKDGERETICIMADFGMGPYAWERDGNIADSITGFPKEYGVSIKLEADFSEWITDFERNSDKAGFNWKTFHERGIELARKLKAEIGERFDIEYCKCIEDPEYSEQYPITWPEGATVKI